MLRIATEGASHLACAQRLIDQAHAMLRPDELLPPVMADLIDRHLDLAQQGLDRLRGVVAKEPRVA